MSIKFDDLVIDRVLQGIFEDSEGNVLGGVNQLTNVSIETTVENKDKTDAQGVLVKRFHTSKAVKVSAENAVFSTSLAAMQFGTELDKASSANKLVMPKIIKVNADKIVAGSGGVKEVVLTDDVVSGSMIMFGCTGTGIPDTDAQYKEGTAASATEFKYDTASKTITLPTGVTGVLQIKYNREVSADAIKVAQSADKFPKTCKLTLSVLLCDACDNEVMRHAYLVFPSFQMDPANTISLQTDANQSFAGVAQKDYCSENAELFALYVSADDIEE